jgi:hypothetical protein
VFERGVPVDVKRSALELEIPQEKVSKEEGEPDRDRAQGEIERSPRARNYDGIIVEIRQCLAYAMEPVVIAPKDKDWYKHANKAVPELMNIHQMKIGWIQKFVSFHYLDKLSLSEKITIITNLYDKSGQPVGYDILLRQYFDKLLLEAEEDGEQKLAIVLADGAANKLFVKNNGRWNPSTFTDERLFAEVRKEKLIVPVDNINRTEIGFMHPFKDKEVIFKTKDLTQKRNNTGAKCTDASKPSIATKIGAVLRQPSIYTATHIEKPELCVILEILMRYKSESQRIHYFFGPEKTNEMNISAFHW